MCGVEAVVAGVEVGPGVGAVEAAVDAGPRVLRQARVSVVLDPGVGLGRHVLHLLKHGTLGRVWDRKCDERLF